MSAFSSFSALEVELLEAVFRHRLLSSAQLRVLFTPDRHQTAICKLLAPLRRARVLDAVRARSLRSEKLWYVTARGANALGSAPVTGQTRPRGVTADSAASVLQQHTWAINEVGISFVRAARERDDECGALAWRHEVSHPIADAGRRGQDTWVRADALLRYTAQDGPQITPLAYFIELDRATEPTDDVAAKLRRYALLHRYTPTPRRDQTTSPREPLWRQSYLAFPAVLLVFAPGPHARTPELLQRRIRTVELLARNDPNITTTLASQPGADGIHVLLATLPDLTNRGPFTPIFHDLSTRQPSNILGGQPQPATAIAA